MLAPRLTRSATLAIASAFCLVSLGCSSLNPQVRQDRQRLEKVRRLAKRAKSDPKNAELVMKYSLAVRNTWEAGTFQRCPAPSELTGDSPDPDCVSHPRQHVSRASRLLEKAAEARRSVAPSVLAEKGVLFLVVGRTKAGLKQLERSMQIRPNYDAGIALVVWHGREGAYEKVASACERTYSHLEGKKRRFNFLDVCVRYSGTSGAREALSWASSETREFYRRERQRRQKAKARERRRERAREKRAKKCVASCKERRHLCRSDCHTDSCLASCDRAYQSCIDRCQVEYQQ